ncbi:MAG: hypothetical protein D8M57_18740 [Candidatus Scalindua sp. AMX11]|nr:MAG: hypothetical protein DWQ00_18035 [Candidatus Scalindua sp.]RZV63122.1 MAG: hypothetical protein EX341_18480 [Candidatus Scalindua sp. SCAELEC01]TDE63348.1 MAG: hypothetical protein D8M57_18740 [Candidatus Scalindua sp. AMX11]GJQ57381.1 MAG: hypothetical protein SCALA701_01820 [Candidatus Scalindua sp.]
MGMITNIIFAKTVLLVIVLSCGLNLMIGTTEALTIPEGTTILKVDPPPKREERIAFAQALLREIDEIHVLIPDLSPDQKKWINKQLSSSNSNRKFKAYESDEFVLQTTKSKLGEIKIILEEIIDGNFLGQAINQENEVFKWLYVSTGLIDFYVPFGVTKLINKKLITVPDDKRFEQIGAIGLRFNGIGSSILTAIVGNFITGKLPE